MKCLESNVTELYSVLILKKQIFKPILEILKH